MQPLEPDRINPRAAKMIATVLLLVTLALLAVLLLESALGGILHS